VLGKQTLDEHTNLEEVRDNELPNALPLRRAPFPVLCRTNYIMTSRESWHKCLRLRTKRVRSGTVMNIQIIRAVLYTIVCISRAAYSGHERFCDYYRGNERLEIVIYAAAVVGRFAYFYCSLG